MRSRITEPAQPTGRNAIQKCLGLISDPRISAVIAAGTLLKEFWDGFERRGNQKEISLLIPENDICYSWLMDWLSDLPSRKDSKTFRVYGNRNNGEPSNGMGIQLSPQPCLETQPSTEIKRKKSLIVPAGDGFEFLFDEILVTATKTQTDSGGTDKNYSVFCLVLSFSTTNFKVCEDFVYMLECRSRSKQKPQPKIYYWRYHWRFVRECPSSRAVILPNGEFDAILEDMQRFLAKTQWYEECGIPHRRGYLFEGVAGSGKTSTVLSLANKLERDIYWLNLSSMENEQFLESISEVPSGSILLLEDVDCAFTKREADQAGLSYSTFLNGLDGVTSQDGRILVATTNHPEKLDPALLRPGRIDKRIEFSNATKEQIENLALRFLASDNPKKAKKLAAEWVKEDISMATVQERLLNIVKEEEK